MSRRIAALVLMGIACGIGSAYGQEPAAGPAFVEVTYMPAGVSSDETFLSGNVGGGVKWYAPNNRWGLRGDYRFAVTESKDDAPEFFGRDNRYAHRVYGGVIINTVR